MSKKKPATKKAAAKKTAAGGWRRVVRMVLIVSVLAYCALLFFAVFVADRLLFPAPRPSYGITEPGLFRIAMPGGGEAAAVWLPGKDTRTAVLYFHGNGEDLGRNRRRLAFLRDLTGASVLAIDYPGYGLSGGTPSESGTLRSAEAAFDHLSAVRGYKAGDIVLWGNSLGTGPSVHLASKHAVRAVILNSPFTSVFRTAIPWKILPTDRFDSLAIIDRVQSPLLITHGDKDQVIPFSHGLKLHDAAINAPVKKFIPFPGTGHSSEPISGAEDYHREVVRFIGPGTATR